MKCSSSTEIEFLQAVGAALGTGNLLDFKPVEIREKIEATLRGSGLMLVLDDAEYLLPPTVKVTKAPRLLNWVTSALVGHGVPVGLVATPRFFNALKAVEHSARWDSSQLIRQITHYEQLPAMLSDDDLAIVARGFLPELKPAEIELLVCYVKTVGKCIGAIESVTRRAKYLAEKSRRELVGFDELKRALTEAVMPSDTALADALRKASIKHGGNGNAPRLRHPRNAAAMPLPQQSGKQDFDEGVGSLSPSRLPAPGVAQTRQHGALVDS